MLESIMESIGCWFPYCALCWEGMVEYCSYSAPCLVMHAYNFRHYEVVSCCKLLFECYNVSLRRVLVLVSMHSNFSLCILSLLC